MKSRKNIFFCILFLLLPYLLFVQPSGKIQIITLLCLSILFICSGYISSIKYMFNSLEFIALYYLLIYLYKFIGINSILPLTHILTIFIFYLFLYKIKKYIPVKKIFKTGSLKGSVGASIVLTLGSLTGLFFWFYFQTDNPWAEMIPQASIVALILLGIGFAFLNAVYEEAMFRGVLLASFTKATNFYIALVLQAVWFSFLHYQAGFPSGFVGIILTFIFGLFAGFLVKRTNGILVPIIIHAISDFSIYILIVFRLRGLI